MLADILHRVAAELQEERQPYKPRPSLAGPERCIRSLVYYANKTPPAPLPGRALLIFEDSKWDEDITKDRIRKTAYTVHSEGMKVPTRFGDAEIDWIITDVLGEDIHVESKSINHFSFERIWKGQLPLDYLTQISLYMEGLQKINPDLKKCMLLCKNKNTEQYLEIVAEYHSESDTLTVTNMARSDGQRSKPDFTIKRVCQSAKEKFDEVERHRKAKTLPDRPFEVGTEYPCGYCAWAKTCWQGYESEFVQLAKEQEIDQELEDICAYYLQASGDAKEMDKEAKRLKEIISNYMREKEYMSGRVGPYVVTRSLRHSTSWNEDLIPPDIAAIAKQDKPFEVLTIRRPKAKEEK